MLSNLTVQCHKWIFNSLLQIEKASLFIFQSIDYDMEKIIKHQIGAAEFKKYMNGWNPSKLEKAYFQTALLVPLPDKEDAAKRKSGWVISWS